MATRPNLRGRKKSGSPASRPAKPQVREAEKGVCRECGNRLSERYTPAHTKLVRRGQVKKLVRVREVVHGQLFCRLCGLVYDREIAAMRDLSFILPNYRRG